MALIKGMFVWYKDSLLGLPVVVAFQYNPVETTRTLSFASELGAGGEISRNLPKRPVEKYALTLEFDATDGLERGAPLTTTMGIGPRLAALEMLMQPTGTAELAAALGRTGANVPSQKLPIVLFVWGPGRVTPVRLSTLKIQETAYDELLNPIHASVDVGFDVIRASDPDLEDRDTRRAATYYEASREAKAILQMAQTAELFRQ